jgi:hypothetical protein
MLLEDFAVDIVKEYGRLRSNHDFGIAESVITYIKRCLAIWSSGVGDADNWYQFFEHLRAFLRTLGLPDPPAPFIATFISELARDDITPVSDMFAELSVRAIEEIKGEG